MPVKELVLKLEILIDNDTEKNREIVAKELSKLLNKNYNKLNIKEKEFTEDLSVMEEIDGIKEPAILHMKLSKIKNILKFFSN